ncbi:MerR family transcriptional regulator [Thiomicrorhabdus sediminis]|uniref:MerR family transcriptional regulator n=1 Tax=Thiomicrorhabdus sediminis TaxID=2580412 RepID=A0A4P9K4M8_9GAMM|nr:MerR family transcriptional regulator [Thiomicrorhabdus sediminis]QCU89915.1 MerR family transcriptional regulator [Thiomicrorhabdus sediminis]
MSHDKALYPIREIARLTGVSPITLRAWERRYDLIEPVRTDSGHRLYNQAHIDYINEAVELTKQGVAISKVKAILAEREQQRLSTLDRDENSFVDELINASRACNDSKIKELLFQLYAEFWHEQIQQVLFKVTFALTEEQSAVRLLWQNSVLPLLFSRVYQANKQARLSQSNKIMLIGAGQADLDGQLIQAIISNEVVAIGAKPVIGRRLKSSPSTDKLLLNELKALHCGIVLVYAVTDASNQLSEWLKWAKNHQSIEVLFVSEEQIELTNQPVNFATFRFADGIVLN